jgi:hypothetical protein
MTSRTKFSRVSATPIYDRINQDLSFTAIGRKLQIYKAVKRDELHRVRSSEL